MLSKLEPATIKLFEAVSARAKSLGEILLQRGMFRNRGNWSQTVSNLLDTKRWPSHGQPIFWRDAQDATLGLTIDYMPPDDDVWQMYWQLYCLQRLAVGDRQKLFESEYASLVVDSGVS